MRFAVSPLHETLLSLRVLQEPGLSALHLPWRRSVLGELGKLDGELLMSLVAAHRSLPDFVTPPPSCFAPAFEEQLARVRHVSAAQVRRDLVAAHAPDPLPPPLHDATADDASVLRLRDDICELLRQFWTVAIEPTWTRMYRLLEADMTYRARQLALGGARLLFAGIHPNLRWDDGVLHIDKMIGRHEVTACGQGLLLLPSVFAHNLLRRLTHMNNRPGLVYPSRGVATLWATTPPADPTTLASLLGAPRATMIGLLEDPMPTIELVRRLKVTPSAVSQHVRVLYDAGLVSRVRDGRHVLYHRSSLGDLLIG